MMGAHGATPTTDAQRKAEQMTTARDKNNEAQSTPPLAICSTAGFDDEHEWKLRDAAFDHEYVTESILYWECEKCGKTKAPESGDFDYLEWDSLLSG